MKRIHIKLYEDSRDLMAREAYEVLNTDYHCGTYNFHIREEAEKIAQKIAIDSILAVCAFRPLCFCVDHVGHVDQTAPKCIYNVFF